MGGFGWGFGGFFRFLQELAQFVGVVVIAAVLIGLAVLLARYLLVATKAAQRYLELNGAPESPGAPPEPPAPEPPAPAPTSEPVAPEPPAPAPADAPRATKPRTTKKPSS